MVASHRLVSDKHFLPFSMAVLYSLSLSVCLSVCLSLSVFVSVCLSLHPLSQCGIVDEGMKVRSAVKLDLSMVLCFLRLEWVRI